MKSDARGFFSIDAMFAVTLVLIISTSFLNLYEGRKAGAELMGARLEVKMVGETLAAAINTVYANGSDFELYIDLPENVGSYHYQITFDNTTRQISVENSAWGAVSVGVASKNIENFVLNPENLESTIRVYWADNQIKVVNA